MDSQSLPKLPVIEFPEEDLSPDTETWLSIAKQVCHAIEEYGCFVINCNKISLDLHNSLYGEQLQQLFNLPTEVKQLVKPTASKPFRKAFSQNPNHDGIIMDSIISSEDAHNLTNILYPAGNDRFCENALEISRIMMNLDQIVVRMVFQNYRVEKLYDSHVGSIDYVTGIFKYKKAEKIEDCLGLFSHTDKTFSTMLHQNDVNGLEIQTKDDQWILYDPPSHSSFLYLAGDALKVWSNNRTKSCYHRVVMSGSKTRFSVGLFMFHNGLVHAPDELVDEDHPLRYKPFNNREYYKLCIENGAKNIPYSIEAHCGVELQ